MKVIQQTFTLLTLRERPVGIWILSSFTAVLGLLVFISSNWPIDFFGLFCIFCANLMMFGSPVKTCRFDKHLNRVILKQKGWLGTQVTGYSIDKITDVQVEESNLGGIRFYRLTLTLLSGQRFYLTPIPSTDWQLQQSLASYIQQFLSH
ncbi:hypothetical protein H6F78_10420 [Coleofasciculus sp. FACHB-64]|uniref:hypothetical protein n=1 Tax=Cyanophyceae TaxID=3028117 RepID=UPI0016894CB0|nr:MULTISPECIES: hypothetical protein [unclassified Coleofasciculus]MBD1840879.1 hypothetical protein [Coleofasciculus sp. FACHB-501]MBD1878393.1 hypothetical protein [Coleofasciculus sp. FACHB-T130]MBD2046004.1 hypothetical protein [Coleofasciculus sp. FACHB-64]